MMMEEESKTVVVAPFPEGLFHDHSKLRILSNHSWLDLQIATSLACSPCLLTDPNAAKYSEFELAADCERPC